MGYSVGEVVQGTVVEIKHYGAFVELADGKRGLVHISEIAHTYVKDIRKHLRVRDRVKAKVVAVGPDGRIDLSIKKLLPEALASVSAAGSERRESGKMYSHDLHSAIPLLTFEQKMESFIKSSNARIAELRQHIDSKHKRR